jgi:hypothetical protein
MSVATEITSPKDLALVRGWRDVLTMAMLPRLAKDFGVCFGNLLIKVIKILGRAGGGSSAGL